MNASGRAVRAQVRSLNETDDNVEPAGELPQYRHRDEAAKPPPAAEGSPPMGEKPYVGPPNNVDDQNPGEGPRTDEPQEG